MSKKSEPWWEEIPVSGDVVVVSIGDYARNVAAGKDVTQIVRNVLGEPTATDRQEIDASFAELKQKLADLEGLTTKQLVLAEDRLEVLEKELTKEDESPHASVIRQAGDWLLENIPEIAEALASLFATPAVGRVIGKAGAMAITWVKTRFSGMKA